MKRLCVLISGKGSNLQALLGEARSAGALNGTQVVLVVSNKADAYGLTRAASSGVDTAICVWDKSKQSRATYDAILAQTVNTCKPDLVVLAGFMHIVGEAFLSAVSCPVINLHPALPESYIGVGAIEKGFTDWQAGAQTTHGVMVHHVSLQVDRGAVICTQTIAPTSHDTLHNFGEKMHAAERQALICAVQQVFDLQT